MRRSREEKEKELRERGVGWRRRSKEEELGGGGVDSIMSVEKDEGWKG